MLNHAKLSNGFCGEAIPITCFIQNKIFMYQYYKIKHHMKFGMVSNWMRAILKNWLSDICPRS
jgi:hypothetical protein